jgi:hypothetical protein
LQRGVLGVRASAKRIAGGAAEAQTTKVAQIADTHAKVRSVAHVSYVALLRRECLRVERSSAEVALGYKLFVLT